MRRIAALAAFIASPAAIASLAAFAVTLAALAAPAGASDGNFRHRERAPDAPPLPKIEYYCTDAEGARRELGEVICIRAGCRSWLARCEMSLNSPMWREIRDGCPGVSLEGRRAGPGGQGRQGRS